MKRASRMLADEWSSWLGDYRGRFNTYMAAVEIANGWDGEGDEPVGWVHESELEGWGHELLVELVYVTGVTA